MFRYGCFLLDACGVIRGAEFIDASGDTEAWIKAVELLNRRTDFRDIEVWERSRRIKPTRPGQGDESLDDAHEALDDVIVRRVAQPARPRNDC